MVQQTSELEQDTTPTGLEKKHRNGGFRMLRMALFAIGGAVLGFAYYRLVGCRTGTCPLTSNPYMATIYGALIGFVVGRV